MLMLTFSFEGYWEGNEMAAAPRPFEPVHAYVRLG